MDLTLFPLVYGLLFLRATGSVSGAFSFTNSGELGYYICEYDADYRPLPLATSNGIFQMVFFNTTPNAYALAIRLGYHAQAETMRFVWTANRNDLVRENATLKYGTDGNLLLSDADGRAVWSTNTSNKGVVGIELRNNGNLVLYDKKNKTVWQSFDHATDSLLVGQSLNIGGVKKLVSRVSDKDGSEGPYSLAMEAGGFALYASFPKPLPYWTLSFYEGIKDIFAITHTCKKPVSSITFQSNTEAENGYSQMMEMRLANFTAPPELRAPELCKLTSDQTTSALYSFNTPRFNTTLSFLRLDSDGDLRMYTYSPGIEFNTWDITYQKFGCWRGVPVCGLPRKCGGFGVCEKGQCVACPEVDGFKGWSTNCSPPSLPNCKDASSNTSVDFYKVVGAEHFSSKYVNAERNGKTTIEECRRRCLNDCTCAAFFYWEESSACLNTQTVGTLNQLGNSTHLAFIKIVKKV